MTAYAPLLQIQWELAIHDEKIFFGRDYNNKKSRDMSRQCSTPIGIPTSVEKICRDDVTRTHDPLVPNQMRYQLRHIPIPDGALPPRDCKGKAFFDKNKNLA